MPHDLHMPCRFRSATGAEADTLADIRVAAMRPSLEAIGRFSPERARERFLKGFDPADTTVIECGEEVAGFFVVFSLENSSRTMTRMASSSSAETMSVGITNIGGPGGFLLTASSCISCVGNSTMRRPSRSKTA